MEMGSKMVRMSMKTVPIKRKGKKWESFLKIVLFFGSFLIWTDKFFEVAGSSTKPKEPKTREIQTQTVGVVPTFVLGDVDADSNRQTIQNPPRSVDRGRPNDLPAFATQERRPSLSRRRNFSLSLSPRLNQNFTYTASEDIDVDPISNDNRPTQEQIYRRKTSMPSRPSDLPLLFSHNENNKKRRW